MSNYGVTMIWYFALTLLVKVFLCIHLQHFEHFGRRMNLFMGTGSLNTHAGSVCKYLCFCVYTSKNIQQHVYPVKSSFLWFSRKQRSVTAGVWGSGLNSSPPTWRTAWASAPTDSSHTQVTTCTYAPIRAPVYSGSYLTARLGRIGRVS